MQLVIRGPGADDASGLARASRDLGEQYARLEPERFHVPDEDAQIEWFKQAIETPPPADSIWLVAEFEGEAVGDAQAVLREPAETADIQPQLDVGRRRAYLNWLAVQERHRSRGIGGRLLDAIEKWARENGAELIATDTNLRSNMGAVEFYERHGYERQAVILRKSLNQ